MNGARAVHGADLVQLAQSQSKRGVAINTATTHLPPVFQTPGNPAGQKTPWLGSDPWVPGIYCMIGVINQLDLHNIHFGLTNVTSVLPPTI